MNYTYIDCKTTGCEHTAPADTKLCRYCRGRVEDKAIVAARRRENKRTPKGKLILRPVLRCFLIVVKKKEPVAKAVKPVKLFPVAPEDMKIGMTIAQHGKVISAKRTVGRGLYVKGTGKRRKLVHAHAGSKREKTLISKGFKPYLPGLKGIGFKTDQHEAFFTDDASVWCARTK